MFCSHCGQTVSDQSTFCRNCGYAIDTTGTATFAPTSLSPVAGPDAAASSVAPPTTSNKAIASLILGLFSLIFLPAIPAVILGHLALSEIKRSAGKIRGKGMAIAGLILGYLGILLILILIITAIAVPNLTRVHNSADEAEAVSNIQSIHKAEVAYSNSHHELGYTCSLPTLRKEGLIEESLSQGNQHGYWYVVKNCAIGFNKPNKHYEIVASPVNWKQSGVRSFCSDESKVTKFDVHGSSDCSNGKTLE